MKLEYSFSTVKLKYKFLRSIINQNHDQMSEAILDGVSFDVTDNRGRNILFIASIIGNNKIFSSLTLISPTELYFKKDMHGNTPLHAAAWHGRYNFVEIFLESGADPFVENNNNETPIQIAEKRENYKVKSLLEKYGEKAVNKVSQTKYMIVYPIHISSYLGLFDEAKLYIECSDDINLKTENSGKTGLHISVERGFYDLAQLFIINQCDINCSRSSDGMTALEIAKNNQDLKMVELIEDYLSIQGFSSYHAED